MNLERINRFWQETREELAAVSMDAEVAEADPGGAMHEAVKTFQNHSVRFTSLGGKRIRAWYTLPIGAPPAGGWPAIITAPGYFGIQSLSLHYVRHGYAVLAVYPRGQGESMAEWRLDHGTKITHHLEDRYRYYYRGAFADLVRGMDFLSTREELDHRRIGTWGMSQGGGFALAVASLDSRIRAASAEVAWPLHFKVSTSIETGPYGELCAYLREHPDRAGAIMENLEYFDAYNLVQNITCPVLVNAVVIDEIHPCRTIMPVFERIPGLKSVIVYPDIEHGTRADFARHTLDWLDRYLR